MYDDHSTDGTYEIAKSCEDIYNIEVFRTSMDEEIFIIDREIVILMPSKRLQDIMNGLLCLMGMSILVLMDQMMSIIFGKIH